MPDASTPIKHISLERLELYDSLIKNYIDTEDAKSLKTVALSADGKSLNFYRIEEPVGSSIPAYSIEIPQANLDPYMRKVATALAGNIPEFVSGGGVVDSGVAINDLATKSYVDSAVAGIVDATTHLTKQIVDTIPAVAEAEENVIYLIKVPSATGNDQYEEWMKIGNEVVMIGDTSTNMSNYYTKSETDSAISTATSNLSTTLTADYEAKIDAALGDANEYTDASVSGLGTRLTTAENNITALQSNVSALSTTVSDHTTRIEALEAGGADIEIATEAEIRALFSSGS